MKWIPQAYQRKALKFVLNHSCAGLFLDPGLGKTSICLAAFHVLRKENMVKRALVIAPLRPARSVWDSSNERSEARKWEDFHDIECVLLHGPKRREIMQRVREKNWSGIVVVNPEGLSWLFQHCPADWLFDMLIVDESTRFKHIRTLRFKSLRPWLHKFRRRIILTGTPAPNGLIDLFGQIHILDLGNALGHYITQYRFQFFRPTTHFGGFPNGWVPKEGAEEQIYERLKPLVLRMAGEDYLKLPKLMPPNDILIDLPQAARHAYDQMEELMLARVGENMVTAVNAGAATIKCRQIANGGIYHDGDNTRWHHIHEAKIEATQELVEELDGKPALIAYEFKHDLDRLQKAFKGAPYLGGGVKGSEQVAIEAAWNRGELPVLLAQPQSVAHGLNLQDVGSAVIWHSLTWDLENYDQFIRRVHRQGQKERVIVHRLIARNTVDEIIVKALAGKARTQGALLGALRDYALHRR